MSDKKSSERPGIVLYFENWKSILLLNDRDVVRLLTAALKYGETGEEPTGFDSNPYMSALWSQIRATISRDADRYRLRCLKNKHNVYQRIEKTAGRVPLSFDDWLELQSNGDDYSPSSSIDVKTNQTESKPEIQTQSQTGVKAREDDLAPWVRKAEEARRRE